MLRAFAPTLGAIMSQPDQHYTANILLCSLSAEDLDILKPHLTRVNLAQRQVLVTPNKAIEHVYFPEGGIVSIVSVTAHSGRTETGIFGRDGVSATCLLLGTDRSPHETFVQVDSSTALRIDADKYLAAIKKSESLRTMLLRYVQTVLVHAAQSTVTNAHHRIAWHAGC
jgi:CRP-like cAMP-binding protein